MSTRKAISCDQMTVIEGCIFKVDKSHQPLFPLGGHGWRSCNISAFRPQDFQFDTGSAKILIFVWPSFLPKLTQLSIFSG